jgi:hypothetical protein
MHVEMGHVGVEGCGISGTLIKHGRGTGGKPLTGSRDLGISMTSFVHNLHSCCTHPSQIRNVLELEEANLLGSEQRLLYNWKVSKVAKVVARIGYRSRGQ